MESLVFLHRSTHCSKQVYMCFKCGVDETVTQFVILHIQTMDRKKNLQSLRQRDRHVQLVHEIHFVVYLTTYIISAWQKGCL